MLPCLTLGTCRQKAFSAMQTLWTQVESEDVVFALETIVENFGSEMAPFAVGLCQHLSQAFWRLQASRKLPTPTGPARTHEGTPLYWRAQRQAVLHLEGAHATRHH